MSWPARIKDVGGIRNQFSHVIDIVPTILEASGIAQPQVVDGIPQRPIEGVSMAYTWDKANANAPDEAHHAVLRDVRLAGDLPRRVDRCGAAARAAVGDGQPSPPPEAFKWELYDLNDDWTENHDLAREEPDRLKEMQDLFTSEATKYNVFPLDNSVVGRLVAPRPNPTAGRNVFTYSGTVANVGWGGAPSLLISRTRSRPMSRSRKGARRHARHRRAAASADTASTCSMAGRCSPGPSST